VLSGQIVVDRARPQLAELRSGRLGDLLRKVDERLLGIRSAVER